MWYIISLLFRTNLIIFIFWMESCTKSYISKVINSSLWRYICVNLTNIWHVLFIMCINSVLILINPIDILHDYWLLTWSFRFSCGAPIALLQVTQQCIFFCLSFHFCQHYRLLQRASCIVSCLITWIWTFMPWVKTWG